MDIQSGGEHEQMSTEWQCLEMARLNGILKQYGVADKHLRREICAEYLFGAGYVFDAGWFQHGTQRLYPQLCFAEREADPSENLGAVRVLYVPSEDYSMHEMAFGNADWYFEERGEDISEIKTGSYQQADEPDA